MQFQKGVTKGVCVCVWLCVVACRCGSMWLSTSLQYGKIVDKRAFHKFMKETKKQLQGIGKVSCSSPQNISLSGLHYAKLTAWHTSATLRNTVVFMSTSYKWQR